MLDQLITRAHEENTFFRADTTTEQRIEAAFLSHFDLSDCQVGAWLGQSHQAVHEGNTAWLPCSNRNLKRIEQWWVTGSSLTAGQNLRLHSYREELTLTPLYDTTVHSVTEPNYCSTNGGSWTASNTPGASSLAQRDRFIPR